MRVYLAGPVLNAENGGRGWREDIRASEFGDIEWADPTQEIGYEEALSMPPKDLVAHDKEMIRESDALLVGYSETLSVGTWREVEYAVETCGMPVATWLGPCEKEPEEYTLSPWVYEAGKVSDSLNACLNYLRRIENRGIHYNGGKQ